MRPRRFSPRKRASSTPASLASIRFNEAAAFFAAEGGVGKLAAARRGVGFNEAAAFFAAEDHGVGERIIEMHHASMRPRRFSPRKVEIELDRRTESMALQ